MNYSVQLARGRTLNDAVAASLEGRASPMARGTPVHVAMQRTARTHSTSLRPGCDEPYLKVSRRSPCLSWQIHDESYHRSKRNFYRSRTPGTQQSMIRHRGFHDTKNGGFSTIGRTRARPMSQSFPCCLTLIPTGSRTVSPPTNVDDPAVPPLPACAALPPRRSSTHPRLTQQRQAPPQPSSAMLSGKGKRDMKTDSNGTTP